MTGKIWGCAFLTRTGALISPRSLLRIAVFATLSSVWWASAIPAFAQNPPSGDSHADSIRGVVINSVTHEAIGRALVSSPDNRFAVMTDSEGHFEFTFAPEDKNAESGSPNPAPERPNMLTARKPGFLTDHDAAENLQSLPGGKELTIPLTPESLIIGRVVLPTSQERARSPIPLCEFHLKAASFPDTS